MSNLAVERQRIQRILESHNKKVKEAERKLLCEGGVDKKSYSDMKSPAEVEANMRVSRILRTLKGEIPRRERQLDQLISYSESLNKLADLAVETKNLFVMFYASKGNNAQPLHERALLLRKEICAALNARIGNSYIFAGAKISTRPVPEFTEPNVRGKYINADYYKGDKNAQSMFLDGEQYEYGVTADELAIRKLLAAVTLMADGYDERSGKIDHTHDEMILTLTDDLSLGIGDLCYRPVRAIKVMQRYLNDKKRELEHFSKLYGSEKYNGASDEKRQKAAAELAMLNAEAEAIRLMIQAQNKRLEKFMAALS